MAGATYHVEFSDQAAQSVLNRAAAALGDPLPLYRDLGEGLLPRTKARFSTQTDPEGNAWEPLSARYQRRKKYNRDRILTLRGYLSRTLLYQASAEALLIGSNQKYAAIHQFGGEIKIAARSQSLFFKQGKEGAIGNRFVKKAKSNFAQRATIGAYSIHMPARAYLGLSADDREFVLDTAGRYLDDAMGLQ